MRSPSARKVWIEIDIVLTDDNFASSPSARKVWIEIPRSIEVWNSDKTSPSARKVWIEMDIDHMIAEKTGVTFRKEGVD